MSDRELLEDIHKMLTKICNYIDKIEDPKHIQKDYNMQFLLNVVADMYVESLEKIRTNNEDNKRENI